MLTLAAWKLAIRPATLSVGVAPILVACAIAQYRHVFDWNIAILVLLTTLLIQIGTNLANDAFDFEKGADNSDRIGPARAAQLGLLTPKQLKWGTAVSLLLAMALGLSLIVKGGLMIAAIGILSLVCAVAYTAGPWPLAYQGLGDLFVFVFFGVVAVCGAMFLFEQHVPQIAWGLSLSVGMFATAVLVVNNLRDSKTDARVGKRTLVVRLGDGFGALEYAVLLLGAYTVPPILWALDIAPWSIMISMTTLPVSVKLIVRVYFYKSARDLIPILGHTAQLQLLYCVLLAVGLVAH